MSTSSLGAQRSSSNLAQGEAKQFETPAVITGDKLRFAVRHASSEDPGYLARELNVHGPMTLGWQSLKFCDYPQELGFEILEGEKCLTQLQLLSHQFKIASRVEIFVGVGLAYSTAKFERLGFMSLDINERSNLTARELKTVYVEDRVAQFIKFIVHRPHSNSQNLFSQVGIIAVNILGKDKPSPPPPVDAATTEAGPPTAEPKIEPGMKASSSSVKAASYVDGPSSDLGYAYSMDEQTAKRLKYLAEAKAAAIKAEDFTRAKELKELERECKDTGHRLVQLDVAKADAVKAEDFDKAKELKEEAEGMRREMDQKIALLFGGAPPAPAPSSSSSSSSSSASRPPSSGEAKASARGTEVDEGGSKSSKGEADQGAAADADPSSLGSPFPFSPPSVRAAIEPQPVEPPKDHPLKGVPDFEDLPEPEPLDDEAQATADHSGLLPLLGQYRVECLFSKTWALREAAFAKVRLMIEPENYFARMEGGLEGCIAELAMMIRIGVEDKAQHVLVRAVGLLGDLLHHLRGAQLPRAVLVPFLDPVVQTLVDKLADGNHRFRDAARRGIDYIADAEAVGPNVVTQHVLKPLGDKLRSKNAWRPVVSRLALLRDFVATYGFGGGVGFSPESIMGFMRAHACFSHSHAEVRDAARDLTVAVQALVGSAVIDSYLQQLRPRQLEEYQAAFAKAAADARTHSTMRREFSDHHDLSPRSRRRKQEQQKKVNTAAARAEAKTSSHASMGEAEDEGGAVDFTKCMFCGAGAPHWNEDALDLHYWKDCPVLAPCPACAQVVEVAGLPEHLLRECEYHDAFVHCKTTGLAIRKSEWAAWEVGPNCRSAPSDSFFCPLCLELVQDSDPAWRKHLVFGCRGNARGSYSPSKGARAGGEGQGSPPKAENPHWYAMS